MGGGGGGGETEDGTIYTIHGSYGHRIHRFIGSPKNTPNSGQLIAQDSSLSAAMCMGRTEGSTQGCGIRLLQGEDLSRNDHGPLWHPDSECTVQTVNLYHAVQPRHWHTKDISQHLRAANDKQECHKSQGWKIQCVTLPQSRKSLHQEEWVHSESNHSSLAGPRLLKWTNDLTKSGAIMCHMGLSVNKVPVVRVPQYAVICSIF